MRMHKQIVHIQSSSDSLFDRGIDDAKVQDIAGAENRLALLLDSLLGACITGSLFQRGEYSFQNNSLSKILNYLFLQLTKLCCSSLWPTLFRSNCLMVSNCGVSYKDDYFLDI